MTGDAATDLYPGVPTETLKRIGLRYEAKNSLAKFIECLHVGYTPAAHHVLLLNALESVERGEIRRLMVLMPPGSAKSTYTSVLFPPWFIGRNPGHSILGISNSTELAEKWGRKVRNIVGQVEFRRVFGFGLNETMAAAGNWENEHGGEYFAAGMGTAIAGRRADLGIIDDPIRSREDADSEKIREKQWDWYISDFLTRLKPGARQILIQTRWNQDDLAGRLLESEVTGWHVIKLPMEAGPDDPLGRKPGERLWPEYFTQERVEHAKSQDARTWSALYQQEPAPEEGAYFKREWFQEYVQQPIDLHIYAASDYAVSEGAGDYTEHGVFGLDHQGCLYVLDWWRKQANPAEWIETQCDLIARYSPLVWFGEAGPIRKAIEPFLKKRMSERRTPCRLEWLPSINDKVVRARAIQAKASMNDVFLPKHAPYLADLMRQILQFPAGKYDDGVDVLSLIGRGLEHVRKPEIQPKKQPDTALPIASPRSDGLGWMI